MITRIITFIAISFLTCQLALSEDKNRTLSFEYKGDIKVYLSITPFQKNDHEIKGGKDKNSCLLIDNKPFFGSDFQIPKYQFQKFTVVVNGKPINLDVSGMYDPWNVYEGKDYMTENNIKILPYFKDAYLVRGQFSDGAGSYFSEWLIIGNGSIRTILSNSENIYNFYHDTFGKME
ncbi:MAG: hypothetical protein OEW97_01810 [Gammaproteobacteria bacterium]|nr:hypothetical protein [Gammaproteobacteria bacterium]